MGFAQRIAPEVDRLVWSISQAIGPGDGPEMTRFVEDRGAGELSRVYHFGDFLAEGRLTRSVALARSRYRPPAATLDLLAAWERRGLILARDDAPAEVAWMATESFTPVIDEMWAAIGRMAADQWGGDRAELETVVSVVDDVMSDPGDDHLVAAVHHDLTDPEELPARAFKRLVTLRYVRQADHIRAWEAAGMSAEEIVVLTALWNGATTPPGGNAIDSLAIGGLIDAEGLTPAGRERRQRIEDETDRLADEVWADLDPDRLGRFEQAVTSLHGEPPEDDG